MGIIEKINQQRKEGLDDNKISDQLLDEGISPNEIREAFDQIKVKKAISSENLLENSMMTEENPELNYEQGIQEMEESSQPEEYYSPQQQAPTPQTEEYYSPQESQAGYAEQGAGFDTSTIIEIAEQVFSEKTSRMEKQLDKMNEFVNLAEVKMSGTDERIKRIEKIIDNLQIKILEKISSYGENIESVKKEMSMMQDSFSKTLPKLIEDVEEHKHKKK
jgi:hypothetical protein